MPDGGRTSLCLLQVYLNTVPLLNSPWSSPKKFRFRKSWRSYLEQNLLRITSVKFNILHSGITDPVSDLTGDQ
jgi:hypothetical protein